MAVWRLLEVETHDAFTNMAIDEAILTARIDGIVPNTLRLYCWEPSAVSVGRFQRIEDNVQIENCRKHDVSIVRRITGGGTVYHDAHDELTYSVIVRKDELKAHDVADIYARIYVGLTKALQSMGVTADFNEGSEKTCPNLTLKGRKISGSAQSHKKGIVLQHGTLLLDANFDRMFTFLRVPWIGTSTEIADIARKKITSIREELHRSVSIGEVSNALRKGFEKAIGIDFEKGKLTLNELDSARRLRKEKYETNEWSLHGTSLVA